jgi:hypothetical protein
VPELVTALRRGARFLHSYCDACALEIVERDRERFEDSGVARIRIDLALHERARGRIGRERRSHGTARVCVETHASEERSRRS